MASWPPFIRSKTCPAALPAIAVIGILIEFHLLAERGAVFAPSFGRSGKAGFPTEAGKLFVLPLEIQLKMVTRDKFVVPRLCTVEPA
jgi:hypothetical protein